MPSDDDVYVNAGDSYADTDYQPEPPKEQVNAEKEERAIARANAPIMESIDAWFLEAIRSADSVSNIDLESTVSVDSQLLAYQHLKKLLIAQRESWSQFVPERSDG
jgi:hypothetical protein